MDVIVFENRSMHRGHCAKRVFDKLCEFSTKERFSIKILKIKPLLLITQRNKANWIKPTAQINLKVQN